MPASYGGASGGSSGPTTPAGALLDAVNPLALVSLDGNGAGTTTPFADATETGTLSLLSTLASGTPAAGSYLTADGADGLALSSAAPIGPTVLYAADCTAEAGSESASISGTGSTSTFTLTATAATRTYGSGGATAARVVCPIPAGAQRIEVELGPITAVSGFATGGWRFLTIAHRDAISGGAPTSLWGASFNDANSSTEVYYGGLMGGGNAGANTLSVTNPPVATDVWLRVVLNPRASSLAVMTGLGVASARPTAWYPITTPTSGIVTSYGSFTLADTGAASAIAIVLQSFGGSGTTSITARLTVRVWM